MWLKFAFLKIHQKKKKETKEVWPLNDKVRFFTCVTISFLDVEENEWNSEFSTTHLQNVECQILSTAVGITGC